MQSTGQNGTQAWQPVQLSSSTTAMSFGRLVFSTCLEAVVVLWPHFEEGWSGAHQLRDAEVGGPVGRGYEDLIARVDQRHHRLEDALLGSVAAEDLVGLVRDALKEEGKNKKKTWLGL